MNLDKRVIVRDILDSSEDMQQFRALYEAIFDDVAPSVNIPPKRLSFNPLADYVCPVCDRRLCICAGFPHMSEDEIRHAIQCTPRDLIQSEEDTYNPKQFCHHCNRMTNQSLRMHYRKSKKRIPKFPYRRVFRSDEDAFLYIRSKRIYNLKAFKHVDRMPVYECTCHSCKKSTTATFTQ